MSLLNLVRDAGQVLRLRFADARAYRYSPVVYAAVLAALGALNAVNLAPLLGRDGATVAFALCLMVLRWGLLAWAAGRLTAYFTKQQRSFYGFFLLTEALVLPSVVSVYAPDLLTLFAFWNMWAFAVQVVGLLRISQLGAKFLLVYLLAGVLMLLLVPVLMLVFSAGGWLDFQEIAKNVQEFLANPPQR